MEGKSSTSRTIPDMTDDDNNIYKTSKQKADLLGKTYEKISSDECYSEKFKQIKKDFEKTNNCDLKSKDKNNDDILNMEMTTDELEKALKYKKDSKEGDDKIRYIVYKLLPDEGKKTVLKIFNHFWTKGEIPQKFKHAIVTPILKPGKNAKEPTNYRPISLTSNLGKILETIVNNRLTNYLETNNIINKQQSGFRNNRQTLDHILRLTNDIENCKREGKINLAVFFDMRKCFDTVDRNSILLELKKIGIKGQMYNYLHSFLDNRTFRVKVDNDLSDIYVQTNGVPQGSVISPTLFILLMNSLPNLEDKYPEIKVGKYADDIALWLKPSICSKKIKKNYKGKQGRSKNYIEKASNELINNLENKGFTVNIGKTQAILFNRVGQGTFKNITINGEKVELKNEIKYLGVTFDSQLNFQKHIGELLAKGNQGMRIMYKLAGKGGWGSDAATLRTVYLSLVRSKIIYGCEVYHRATIKRYDRTNKLVKLDQLQNKALRLILGVRKGAGDTNKLGLLTNIEPLTINRKIAIVSLGIRAKINENNPAAETIEKIENHPKFKYKINNYNEEFNSVIKEANITEEEEKKCIIENFWNKKDIEKITITDNEKETENHSITRTIEHKGNGYITRNQNTIDVSYNKGLKNDTIQLDLINMALDRIGHNQKNIITTTKENIIDQINLKTNSNRPEIVKNIREKIAKLEKEGKTIKLGIEKEKNTTK